MSNNHVPRIYKHYKGGLYILLHGFARKSGSTVSEYFCVIVADNTSDVVIMRRSEFMSDVELNDGKRVRRFQPVIGKS